MIPNRFQEAKRIYDSALERDPAQREAYLSEACAGDEVLRKEVESLLGYQTEAQQFFNVPAIEAGAKALARASPIDFTGRTLSHYAIVAKIGEGGMGVVYKARDTHLDRFVALKILPPASVADPERKRRFVQEAKAASSLNHPNIVAIHDIDEAGGVSFIAMEFVNGRTLDRLIRGKGLPLKDTLKHAVQIADALAAAHRSGIIHRDIKPANIMVTGPAGGGHPGLVKVLDFGLAKLTEPSTTGEVGNTRTLGPNTGAGVILGTVAYMSPEQAEGKEVDSRSDIFSLGSVLYEMITGRPPFAGETNVSTLAAILREEPKPVSQLATGTSGEVERVVNRCLRKDPDRRFQHMDDLKVALEELKEESDSRTLTPAGLSAFRRLRWPVWAAGAFLLTVAVCLGAWFGLIGRPAAGPPAKVTALTALRGIQTQSVLSPDGKQVAFMWNGDKQDSFKIYVHLVGDAAARRLTTSPSPEFSPAWSPDALHIAFLRDTPAGIEVVIIPAAGGAEKRLHISTASNCRSHAGVWCGLAWSPDGKFLTFPDRESSGAPNSIFLLDIETRETRQLTKPPRGFQDGRCAFSPDGRTLAFTRLPNLPLSDIYLLPLSASGQPRGEPRRITHDNTFIFGLDWVADGRSIVFASARGGIYALWRVARSGGEPERLPVGGNDAFYPTISRTGDRLVFGQGATDPHLWRVAAPGSGAAGAEAAPIMITHSPRLDQQPVFSPDSRKIAWVSMHTGSHQIWVSNNDGSNPMPLTHLAAPGADVPDWSPDGRQIAFRGFTPGRYVYVIDAEGGAPHRLTTGDFVEGPPEWSRDGKWVYFTSNRGDGIALWKVPAGGGSPMVVLRNFTAAIVSSDGKCVYYRGPEGSIWKAPAGGGSPVLLASDGRPQFVESWDGKFLYYRGPNGSIWKVPVDGGQAAPVLKTGKRAFWTSSPNGIYLLDPDSEGGPTITLLSFGRKHTHVVRLSGQPDAYLEPIRGLAASPDGRWIVYLYRDRTDTELMLVENFR